MQGQQELLQKAVFMTTGLPPAFNMNMIDYAQTEHHMCLQKALSHT